MRAEKGRGFYPFEPTGRPKYTQERKKKYADNEKKADKGGMKKGYGRTKKTRTVLLQAALRWTRTSCVTAHGEKIKTLFTGLGGKTRSPRTI